MFDHSGTRMPKLGLNGVEVGAEKYRALHIRKMLDELAAIDIEHFKFSAQ